MKARLSMLTLSIALAVAVAQDAPQNPQPQGAPQNPQPQAAPQNPQPQGAPQNPQPATKTSTNDSAASCPVSASSSQLGMKLEDGKTVRFDLVGNQRAQDLLKNDKRWSKDISANKPIRAKVSGVLNGDKLIVAAIH